MWRTVTSVFLLCNDASESALMGCFLNISDINIWSLNDDVTTREDIVSKKFTTKCALILSDVFPRLVPNNDPTLFKTEFIIMNYIIDEQINPFLSLIAYEARLQTSGGSRKQRISWIRMSMKELKHMAKQNHVTITKGMVKEDIVKKVKYRIKK